MALFGTGTMISIRVEGTICEHRERGVEQAASAVQGVEKASEDRAAGA